MSGRAGSAWAGPFRRGSTATALAVGLGVCLSAPASAQTGAGDPEAAVLAAREGGVTLVCRHAITDSFREREPVDYDDPSTQRKLDDEGEAQSRRIGAALGRLGVEVVDVIASPMHRAIRTAELMTGRPPRIEPIWHTNGSEYGGEARDARLDFLERPVSAGIVLIVTHIGTMSSVIPEARGRVGEGDCVVVRGGGAGHDVVGIVPWRRWVEAAEGR